MKVVLLTLALALAMGCVAPAPLPADSPVPADTPFPFLARQLDVKIDPKEAASYLLNPSPLGKDGYSKGTMVTIDILPQPGWQVDKWIGPVFKVEGTTAQIQMDSSQSVAVRLVREGVVSGGQAPESPAAAINPTLAVLVERIRNSIVQINASGSGSGFIFETDYPNAKALVMTNAHVVERNRNVDVIVNDSKTLNGKIIGVNHDQDIAVIEICCGEFRALEFADATNIAEGTDVFTMGYPVPFTSQRYDPGMPRMASVIKGIVSRNYFDSERKQWVIQYDAGSNPGNSGGALFNMSGKVVGLHFRGYIQLGYQDMAFAISQVTIAQHLQVLKGGTSVSPTRVPTATLRPTYTPLPTYTPFPTPTATPRPTYTPLPTYTPQPTPTAKVIFVTPQPTPTGSARSYVKKGHEHYDAQNWSSAIEQYTLAIRVDSQFSDAYYWRGLAYDELGEYQRAIQDLDKAIQLDPGSAPFYVVRAVVYRALGQDTKADADDAKACSLDSGWCR